MDFQVPGDFLGLRSVLLRTSDHSFEPVVDIEAAEVLASDLLYAFAGYCQINRTYLLCPDSEL